MPGADSLVNTAAPGPCPGGAYVLSAAAEGGLLIHVPKDAISTSILASVTLVP